MVIFPYVPIKKKTDTLWYINIDPGSCRGWKMSFHYKLVIFRVYVTLWWTNIAMEHHHF